MTPEQEREFRALLAEVDEENSGWRSVMDPVADELRDLRAALAAGQARETGRDALAKTKSADLIEEVRQRAERFDGLVAHCNDLTRQRDDLQGLLDQCAVREARSGERVRVAIEQRDELLAQVRAGQAREVTLRAFVERTRDELGHARILSSVQRILRLVLVLHVEARALLADPSPASDALGRVARASVALRRFEEEYPLKNGSEWDCRAALNILLSEAMGDWRAAIHNLLAVAPHWGEPQEGEG